MYSSGRLSEEHFRILLATYLVIIQSWSFWGVDLTALGMSWTARMSRVAFINQNVWRKWGDGGSGELGCGGESNLPSFWKKVFFFLFRFRGAKRVDLERDRFSLVFFFFFSIYPRVQLKKKFIKKKWIWYTFSYLNERRRKKEKEKRRRPSFPGENLSLALSAPFLFRANNEQGIGDDKRKSVLGGPKKIRLSDTRRVMCVGSRISPLCFDLVFNKKQTKKEKKPLAFFFFFFF